MKMFAAHEYKTLNEFVLECVRMRLGCTPNKTTEKALQQSESGKGLKRYSNLEELFDDLGI